MSNTQMAVPPRKRKGLFPPTPSEWGGFFYETLLFLGAGLCLAGVIFFFAFNWSSLPKWGKFALLEGGIVSLLLVAWWRGLDSLAGQVALTASSVFVGAFLAVFGQIYQTGADPYQLFLGWAILIAGLVWLARFPVLWFLWIILLHLSIALAAYQIWGYEVLRPRVLLAHLALQTLILVVWEAKDATIEWLRVEGRWIQRAFVGFLAFLLTWHLIALRFERRAFFQDDLFPIPLQYVLTLGLLVGLLLFYSLKKMDLLALCFLFFSVICITTTYLSKSLRGMDQIGFFLILSIVVLIQSALVVKFLTWLQKRDRALAEKKAEEGPLKLPTPSVVGAKISGLVSRSQVLKAATGGFRAFPSPEEAGAAAGKAEKAENTEKKEEAPREEDDDEEAPVDPNAQPWYIQVFVGISAWFSCLLLMGFFGAWLRFDKGSAYLLLGIVLMVAGGFSLRVSKGVFWEQASLVIHLAGHALFWFGLADVVRETRTAATIVAFVELVLLFVVAHPIARLFATIAAAGAGLTAIFPFWKYFATKNIPWWIPETYLLILLGVVVFLWVERAWKEPGVQSPTASPEGPKAQRLVDLRDLQAPVGWGIVLFQMSLAITTIFRGFHPRPGAMMTIVTALFGLVTIALITKKQKIVFSPALWLLAIVVLGGLAAATLFSPGILLALLVLVIGFYNRALVRMGAASAFLVLFLVKFYYDLDLTLLTKSYMLLASGLLLFGLRFLLRFLGQEAPRSTAEEVRHA